MKLKNILLAAMVFAFAAVSVPLHAGTISFDVSGLLGPVLSGLDPLKFSGQTFSANGSLDANALPVSTTADSATYSIPGNIQITVGAIALNGFNALLTVTDPASGPDTLSLDFSVVEMTFTPDVTTVLSLPEGTLNGTALQNFTSSVSQPDSSLTFVLPGGSTSISGTLGVTGTASMTGGVSGLPEPGSIALLASGLLVLGIKVRTLRRR